MTQAEKAVEIVTQTMMVREGHRITHEMAEERARNIVEALSVLTHGWCVDCSAINQTLTYLAELKSRILLEGKGRFKRVDFDCSTDIYFSVLDLIEEETEKLKRKYL